MTWTFIAVIIIVGFIFLLLEILVLPGTNVAGIIGFVLIGIGVWQAYAAYGNVVGSLTLAGSVVFSAAGLYYALKAGTWQKAALKKKIESKVNIINTDNIQVGDIGKAVSRLVPMGKALINDEFFEVHSKQGYIDEGSEIVVKSINFSKILVELK